VQQLDHDEVSIHVDAPPERVYELLTDVTRMPEFSPEIERCTWIPPATSAEVGARFEATNKLQRGRAWKNHPVITVAEPARALAFERTERLAGTLVWRYQIELEGTGTRLTESYEVTSPISRLGWFVIERLYGERDRRTALRNGMSETLRRIAAAAEAPAASHEHG
jgi:uncharacterized protein YndB with AHSA1/START domain